MANPDLDRQRLVILEQLWAGLERYAEVATVLANADDRAAARLAIRELLDCDEYGARAIMDARLEYLTKDRRAAMAAEIEELRGRT